MTPTARRRAEAVPGVRPHSRTRSIGARDTTGSIPGGEKNDCDSPQCAIPTDVARSCDQDARSASIEAENSVVSSFASLPCNRTGRASRRTSGASPLQAHIRPLRRASPEVPQRTRSEAPSARHSVAQNKTGGTPISPEIVGSPRPLTQFRLVQQRGYVPPPHFLG